jgi:chromosome partitioning protein
MILLVGGTKGGTGKSTIATNLAAYRLNDRSDSKMLIIDTDRQGSASDWAYNRANNQLPRISCVQLFGKNLQSEISYLKEDYSDIIIDAGGYDSKELRIGMTVADIMCCPIAASLYDLNTIEGINELVERVQTINVNLSCYIVINKYRSIPSLPEFDEAYDYVKKFESVIPIDFALHERIAFSRSAVQGKGVNEMKNERQKLVDHRAVNELKKLYEVLYE